MAKAKKSKIVAATGVAVGNRAGLEVAKRIEAAMVKAIADTPRKSGESQEAYDERLRKAIRKARDEALDG